MRFILPAMTVRLFGDPTPNNRYDTLTFDQLSIRARSQRVQGVETNFHNKRRTVIG